MKDKPWWYPVKCDADWCKQTRSDMPDETAGMSDEELVEVYNEGAKYQMLWDHAWDAYEEYEPLADAFLEQEAKVERLESGIIKAIRKSEAKTDLNPYGINVPSYFDKLVGTAKILRLLGVDERNYPKREGK